MRSALLTLASLALMANAAHADSKELANGEWVVGAHGAHWEEFSVAREVTLRAEVRGVKHTDNGFRVRLVNAEDVKSCQVRGGTCRQLEGWEHPSERSFTQSDRIPAGRWAFLVENNANLFNAATIRVHLTIEQ